MIYLLGYIVGYLAVGYGVTRNLIGTSTSQVPAIPMSWLLQNESSINGPYAAPGAWAQMDISHVACYSYTGS